jgi:hypothetical protein
VPDGGYITHGHGDHWFGTHELYPRGPETMTAEVNTEEDYLYLFFGERGSRWIGKESLARLEPRLSKSNTHVSAEAWDHQLQEQRWGSGEKSAWSRLEERTLSVLLGNGAHDATVNSGNSFVMAQRLSNATTVFFSDSGQAFFSSTPRNSATASSTSSVRRHARLTDRPRCIAPRSSRCLTGATPRSQLLHDHAGGSVMFSIASDRKAAGHLAKAAGIRSLIRDFRCSPESSPPPQQHDVETAHRWLLSQGHRPEKIASGRHPVGGHDKTRWHCVHRGSTTTST